VCFADVRVKENRTTLLCKKSGGDAEICEVEGSGETSGEKEGEPSRKNPPVNPARWSMRQDNPPRGSLKSLRKTLGARSDATQDLLRNHHRSFERRYTHLQLRRETVYPHARTIHRPFIVPSHAIEVFRGNGHVFGTKSWQPRRKQNIQGSKKQIHMALRFRYAWAGLEMTDLTA